MELGSYFQHFRRENGAGTGETSIPRGGNIFPSLSLNPATRSRILPTCDATFAAEDPDNPGSNYGCPGNFAKKDVDMDHVCVMWPCDFSVDENGVPSDEAMMRPPAP